MQLEVKIDPQQIEKQVTEAIVASAFGKRLNDTIDDVIKNMGNRYSYGDQLKNWIESKMREIVIETVEKEYAEQIKAKLREAFTPEYLKEACEKVVAEGMRKISSKY